MFFELDVLHLDRVPATDFPFLLSCVLIMDPKRPPPHQIFGRPSAFGEVPDDRGPPLPPGLSGSAPFPSGRPQQLYEPLVRREPDTPSRSPFPPVLQQPSPLNYSASPYPHDTSSHAKPSPYAPHYSSEIPPQYQSRQPSHSSIIRNDGVERAKEHEIFSREGKT